MNEQLVHCDERKLTAMLAAENIEPGHTEWISHVEHCRDCQTRLRELAANDSQWRKASAVLSATDGDDAPHLSRRGHDGPTTWNESMVLRMLNPPTHPEMLGRLGRYEIERLIGSGGMGIVFKAFDTELNRTVAVKILAPYLANSDPARKRFAREARSAAGIVDDHVVPIFNVESEREPPFLVMQYIAGGSLQERLDRDGPLNVAEVLRIGLQAAKGLAAAHAQGLIHRDVKPSNILLDEGVERALISDFGLARAEDEVSLTHTGFHPGTPHYMSPEQVRGESIDVRSDLFSLGCVLYVLCTGRLPFRAETSYAVLRRITDEEPRPIQDFHSQLPEWLGRIVTKLLAKSPADRFSSAQQVAQLLERCLAHVNQPADVPLPDLVGSPARRGRNAYRGILAVVGVASLLALAATFAVDVGQDGDKRAQSAQKQPDSAKQMADGSSAAAAVVDDSSQTQPDSKSKDDDAARREFIKLAQQLERQFVFVPTATWSNAGSANGPAGSTGDKPTPTVPHIQIDADNLAVHVESIFLFEESHRGTHIGLMALRKLLLMSSGFASKMEETVSPRTRAVERLVHYADRPILSEILFHVVSHGFDDRSTEPSLRAIIDAPNASKFVRPSAQLNLSKWMLQYEPFVTQPARIERQIRDFADKHDPASKFTVQMLKRQLAVAPDAETFGKWKKEAIATLELLRETATDIRPPGVKASGNRNVVRISHALTKLNPTLSELAARTLKTRTDSAESSPMNAVNEARAAAVRREFIRLVEAFDRQFQQRIGTLPATPAAGDKQTVTDILADGILPLELETLLLFEQQHRGEHVGLMALRKIIAHAKRYATPPKNVRSANARAIQRLEYYGSVPMLAETLLRVSGDGRRMQGFPDRRTEEALRSLLTSPNLSESLRPMAQLALCNWILRFEGFVSNRQRLQQQVERLKSEDNPESQHQARSLQTMLDATPSDEEYRAWKREAIELLSLLEQTATDVRLPSIKVDGHPDILRIDTETAKLRQTISEFAAELLEERSKPKGP